MNIHIEVKEDSVYFITTDNQEIIYDISKQHLPRTDEDNISEWIMQLRHKTWIKTEILYQIASIIKKEFPKNTINWNETFFIVEKVNYLEALEGLLLADKEETSESTYEMLKFRRRETNEETQKIVEEIVNKKLSEFELCD